jgi:hypothetical protein
MCSKGFRCQDYDPDDVEHYQILHFVIYLLTPETRHLKPLSLCYLVPGIS